MGKVSYIQFYMKYGFNKASNNNFFVALPKLNWKYLIIKWKRNILTEKLGKKKI